MQATSESLREQYGLIDGYERDHGDRIHINGFKLFGSGPLVRIVPSRDGSVLYVVICLDPMSPIGQFAGQYCIPFVPDPDFHLDKASLWIYPMGKNEIRIEIRATLPRRFAEHDDQTIGMVYGVQVKAADCYHLQRA